MFSNLYPNVRQNDLVTQDSNSEMLIYDLTNNKVFCLNETSALVWRLCNGKNTIAEISKETSKKLNTNIGEDFIWLSLKQLEKENLLENTKLPPKFSDLSRREVVKRIGLSTALVLPLITSLVAPRVALSASFCNDAGTVINGANPSFDASVCYNEAQMECFSGMATFNSNTCSLAGCTCVVTCLC